MRRGKRILPPVDMRLERGAHKMQWITAVRISREGHICSESALYDKSSFIPTDSDDVTPPLASDF